MSSIPDMPWSFGICVGPTATMGSLFKAIDSIVSQRIPEYEIILLGDFPKSYDLMKIDMKNEGIPVRFVQFNEHIRPGWITRKKNVIAKEAVHENLCIIHDYYSLGDNWYENMCLFSIQDYWKVVSCRVNDGFEGYRSADWVFDPFIMQEFLTANPKWIDVLKTVYPTESPMYVVGLPYDNGFPMQYLTDYTYVSGGAMTLKRDVLLEIPMDENLVWGQAEDVEWSQRARKMAYGPLWNKCNPYSKFVINKPGKWKVFQMPKDVIDAIFTWVTYVRH